MEKILTKEEIDALVAAVNEGKLDPDKELTKGAGVANIDLFNTATHKGLVPNLDIVYDSYIRYNRVTLSNRLRRMVEIRKIGAKPYKFDDFLMTLPSPVCMGIFRIDPLKGACMVAMDSTLVFSIVDSILGGTGKASVMESGRLFTSIELRIMQKVVKDILADLEKAWQPVHQVHLATVRMEMNPRLVNIVPPEYHVVTMETEVQIEDVRGKMVFAVPYMTVEPIREKLKNGAQFDLVAVDPKWSFRLSNELMEAPLEVTVELGRAGINLQELLQLEVGDTIMLDKDVRSELPIKLGGVVKYLGVPGVRHGNKAIQITKTVSRESEQ